MKQNDMNKYAEVFEKQNPEWVQPCMNCNHNNKFRTKNVLRSKKDFVFTCTKCGADNTLKDIPAIIKDFEKQMKKAGIEVK